MSDHEPSEKSPPTWIYYIPLAYFVYTRLVSGHKVVSWFFIYPIPISLACLLFTGGASIPVLSGIFLAIISTYSIYEIGYLQNDTVTIQNETNPTLRLTSAAVDHVRRQWIYVICTRPAISLILCLIIYQLKLPGFGLYCCSLLAIIIVFPVYNRLRGKINVPLHFVLVSSRFCGPALLVFPDLLFFFYLILTFPLLNLFERGAEERYGIDWLQQLPFSNLGSGRYWYYLVVSFLWSALCLSLNVELQTTLIFVYLFLYRLFSPLALSKLQASK